MDNKDPGLLSPTAQARGEYLATIKALALQGYLRREIGSAEDFEDLWRQAFFVEDSKNTEGLQNADEG